MRCPWRGGGTRFQMRGGKHAPIAETAGRHAASVVSRGRTTHATVEASAASRKCSGGERRRRCDMGPQHRKERLVGDRVMARAAPVTEGGGLGARAVGLRGADAHYPRLGGARRASSASGLGRARRQ